MEAYMLALKAPDGGCLFVTKLALLDERYHFRMTMNIIFRIRTLLLLYADTH